MALCWQVGRREWEYTGAGGRAEERVIIGVSYDMRVRAEKIVAKESGELKS